MSSLRFRPIPRSLIVALALFGSGCADVPDAVAPAAAPAIVVGPDGAGVDRADTACRVVLREVGRTPNGQGGYVTLPPDGRYVWDGRVEVALEVADAVPSPAVEVLFQTTLTQGRWYASPATRTDGPATPGFAAYTFRVDAFTPTAGMSGTSLSRTVIRLAPYVALPDGGRAFDHNRVTDVLAAYDLTSANGWSLGAAGACPGTSADGVPRWAFSWPDMAETMAGTPTAGGAVRIAYDGRRLRETAGCLGASGGVSATTVRVGWMLDGDPARGGSADVERWTLAPGYACPGGAACVRQEVMEPLVELPAGARDLAVWFWCVPGFDGAPEVHYDSDDGRNYHAAIALPTPSVGQVGRVGWVGGWALWRARAGDAVALPEPLVYAGFTNMGLAVQAEVWAEGVTDVAAVDPTRLMAWVESDALACAPGAAPTREPLPIAATGAGAYGHDVVFRWGIESLLGRCPKGVYRYRFLVSADGGLTTTALGAAAEAGPDAVDATWRTIESR